jgi:hypothetical protein
MKSNEFTSHIQYGQTKMFGLFSDTHIDSKDCNLKQLKKDLDFMAAKDGRIFFNGDVFDAILHGDRKRHTMGNDMFNTDDQINEIVDYAVDNLKDYVDYIDLIGIGNHETAVLKHHNFSLTRALIKELNHYRSDNLAPIELGDYKGFIRLKFNERVLLNKGKGKDLTYVWEDRKHYFDIMYFHGTGGSAPVTKGMIDFNRISTSYLANLYWTGHKHHAIIDSGQLSMIMGADGQIHEHKKTFIQTPSYMKRRHQERDKYRLSYADEKFLAEVGVNGFGVLELERDEEEPTLNDKVYHKLASMNKDKFI